VVQRHVPGVAPRHDARDTDAVPRLNEIPVEPCACEDVDRAHFEFPDLCLGARSRDVDTETHVRISPEDFGNDAIELDERARIVERLDGRAVMCVRAEGETEQHA
jgi:hypothetical protein